MSCVLKADKPLGNLSLANLLKNIPVVLLHRAAASGFKGEALLGSRVLVKNLITGMSKNIPPSRDCNESKMVCTL